jgi:tRNA uridine 5-carboxymethylaminomethyl modification enzyme
MAGQINGTSGYEEAAAQGLWAGINAALKCQKRSPFILDRSQAYMGVMIDDLVTRGTREPYRMFTSRAEYRLILREDNADLRLMPIGHELGLIGLDTFREVQDRKALISREIDRIRRVTVKPTGAANRHLEGLNSPTLSNGIGLDQLLKRVNIGYTTVTELSESPWPMDMKAARQVEIEIKYEGYIQRQEKEIEKFKHLERIKLPEGFDYAKVHGLSNELKEKLSSVCPESLGQASRIDGMTPSALSVLMIALKSAEKLFRAAGKDGPIP